MCKAKVALLQMTAHSTDQSANVAKGEALLCRAVRGSGYIELTGYTGSD
jgi:hypothetical protein